MAEAVLMVTMTVSELQSMIKSAVNEVIQKEFAPLRKQFEDRLITADETATKLQVTRVTLYNLEKRGHLLPIRVGSKVMYSESAITVYLMSKNK
ncbi:helix-turn-helix protein [Dysgonomonas alginatilytica]|uniref:Helix-turn-helix protein n=1 Tax=Dysgonomonas alginatilytica TaxID=1605892 RepID=A0A2V3PMT9_9BACT|nr:helix-turn-helix domain-containing protein [Dysgonomonas alginatilytica]PXV61210.1 helix-turn-helix protein [Dysgonomonas alginatilytica]